MGFMDRVESVFDQMSLGKKYKGLTATGTLDKDDNLVLVTSTGSDITISLPAVGEAAGKMYSIMLASYTAGDVVKIQDLDDSFGWNDIYLTQDNAGALLMCDGYKWHVMNQPQYNTYVKRVTLANTGTFNIPVVAKDGFLFASDGAAQAILVAVAANGACMKIGGTTQTAAANEVSDLCVYDSGSNYPTVENNLGGSRDIEIIYFYIQQ